MSTDYFCSAIAWAPWVLGLLRREEVEPLERETGIVLFPA